MGLSCSRACAKAVVPPLPPVDGLVRGTAQIGACSLRQFVGGVSCRSSDCKIGRQSKVKSRQLGFKYPRDVHSADHERRSRQPRGDPQFLLSSQLLTSTGLTAPARAWRLLSGAHIVQRFASRKALLDAVPISDALFAELPAEINLFASAADLESPPIPYRDPSPRSRFVESRPPSGSIARKSFRAGTSCGSVPRKAEASRPAS